MINVLVTGSNGQLGRCLQDIANTNEEIKWYFKNSSELDITNKKTTNDLFKKIKFDYLVNCAAYTAVDKAEKEKARAFLVNAEAIKYLAESCKNNNVTLIHVSTDFVFDGNTKTPYTEIDLPNPINVYGASKLKGESYICDALESYFIIRTSWLYSKYGNNFLKTMLRVSKERKELNVVNDQIGTPTYARDLAELIFHIIDKQCNGYGIYHYSNIGEISWYDFAKAIFDFVNNGIKVNAIKTENYPTLAKRPQFSVLDSAKTKEFFNLEMPHWLVGVRKCIKEMG
ncbi:dTDP-4-dehydrorhamnose reductase [Pontimicrobium sp. SW4]|uniref:dTDP-4-dehydrorhamnose reductase n=1 Tax=Pontimicrobium sp. SW4 TaxID=3153519 RepID=A0AAU7BSN6_9FLAO